jgi:hypothetical protein
MHQQSQYTRHHIPESKPKMNEEGKAKTEQQSHLKNHT